MTAYGDSIFPGPETGKSTVSPPTRPLLPIMLAVVAMRGTVLPWVTIRGFDGTVYRYNLTDLRGGIGILLTVLAVAVLGGLVLIFRRLTGLTILSLSCAIVGWLAAISGLLLGAISAVLPAVGLAGVDLSRALVAQGSGVAVTVVSSLSLAFIVVRQYEPLSRYSNKNRVSVLPLGALVPLFVLSINMHAEWVRLSNDQSDLGAIIAGDSIFGSGLLVIALWMTMGAWIAALVVQRPMVSRFAGVASIASGLVVLMYSTFVWVGGKALAALIPSNVDQWASVDVSPVLYIVLISALGLLFCGILALFNQVSTHSVSVTDSIILGGRRLYSADILAIVLFVSVVVSLAVTAR